MSILPKIGECLGVKSVSRRMVVRGSQSKKKWETARTGCWEEEKGGQVRHEDTLNEH